MNNTAIHYWYVKKSGKRKGVEPIVFTESLRK